MKGVRVQGEVAHFRLGDHEASLIASLIELGFDAQPGGRSGVADQLDEGLEGAERTTDGAVVIQPAPARYFEFPIPYPLPEGLNFIR